MSKYIVDEFEAQDLAGAIFGIKEEDYESNEEKDWEQAVEEALFDNRNVDLADYRMIVNDLMKLITVACSPITDNVYIGFSEPGMWLIKKECDNWIQQVLQWLGGSDSAKPGEKWEREITVGDKIEYKITLEKVTKV